jgi:hypothetical protein
MATKKAKPALVITKKDVKQSSQQMKNAGKKAPARPNIASSTVKASSGKKDLMSIAQDITNRYRVTAREARDIVTSVGSLGKASVLRESGDTSGMKKAAKDVFKQVKETGKAAVTGKKGTTAAKAVKDPGYKIKNTNGKTLTGVKIASGSQRVLRQTGTAKSMKKTKGSKGN